MANYKDTNASPCLPPIEYTVEELKVDKKTASL